MGAAEKPKLNINEQIEHLHSKGIKFGIIKRDDAVQYLSKNNNYFKLTAYRKNFEKYIEGENTGKYIDLEFAQLQDLSIIDMRLRYQLLDMALDVEHFAKVKLLKYIEDRSEEDGYTIVEDYRKSLPCDNLKRLDRDIQDRGHSPYCGDIIAKHQGEFPIWAFVEVLSFGGFITFFQYCAKRFSDADLEETAFLLLATKDLRNAAAHSNCILNELNTISIRDPKQQVMKALAEIGVSQKARKYKMKNIRLQQIVTLLYVHRMLVTSEGVHNIHSQKLHELLARMYRHIDYYRTNSTITSSFDFLRKVVDNWFATEI